MCGVVCVVCGVNSFERDPIDISTPVVADLTAPCPGRCSDLRHPAAEDRPGCLGLNPNQHEDARRTHPTPSPAP